MIHLGDICKINGAEIPRVDVITFGSPCQDVSVAGARKGIVHTEHGGEETTRSGLFFEAIRIIREMREADKADGRADEFIRPRFGILENVPGLFSSNKGEDFRAVLTEIVRIAEPDAPDVPMPDVKGGWPYCGCLYEDMGGWSVAWRVHDLQYWGCPQRRKRVCVFFDLGGLTAPWILFDPQLRREAEGTNAVYAVGDTGGIG